MQILVINEMRAYVSLYRKRGQTVRVTRNPHPRGAWVVAAKAWNSKQRCYQYLLVGGEK